MTWWPVFTDVTPGPTSTTTPAPSCPRMAGNSPSGSAPDSVNSSVWQMPVALISTNTSPAFGPSRSTSTTSSGLAFSKATAARVFMTVSLGRHIAQSTQGLCHLKPDGQDLPTIGKRPCPPCRLLQAPKLDAGALERTGPRLVGQLHVADEAVAACQIDDAGFSAGANKGAHRDVVRLTVRIGDLEIEELHIALLDAKLDRTEPAILAADMDDDVVDLEADLR